MSLEEIVEQEKELDPKKLEKLEHGKKSLLASLAGGEMVFCFWGVISEPARAALN